MLILWGRELSVSKKLQKIDIPLSCKSSRVQVSVLGYTTDPYWSFSLVVLPLISPGVEYK